MNTRRTVLAICFTFVLSAVAAFADIRFEPPNPTPHSSVDAIVSGTWTDGCGPTSRNIVMSGSTITIHFVSSLLPCPALLIPLETRLHLGVLAAGTYTVTAVQDVGTFSQEFGRATLIVRDDETLHITPYAVPTSGGAIAITNPFFLAAATVTIGGVPVPADSNTDGLLVANAPPHSAGAVDVTVSSTTGSVVTAKAALIYYDASVADPAVFEPILFPLSFAGAGALGSQWTTDSFIHANAAAAYFRDPLPCDGCTNSFGTGTKRLATNANAWGHVLYAMRGTTGVVDFASRIRDTSRQAQTAGTEVPVVRESDFRKRDLHFVNVPVDARYRAMVRVWSIAEVPLVIVNVTSIPSQQLPVPLTRIAGTAMWFGAVDITPLLPRSSDNPTLVTAYAAGFPGTLPPPLWGMLSLTNNETQQVTIVTPH